MSSSDKQNLLEDTLRNEDYEHFRKNLLHATAREFRRNHRATRRHLWIAIAALVVLTGICIQLLRPPSGIKPAPQIANQTPPIPPSAPAPYSTFTTRPLPHATVVTTSPATHITIATPATVPQIQIVRTSPVPPQSINDDELLASFPDRAVGLIQQPGGKQLLFVSNLIPPRESVE